MKTILLITISFPPFGGIASIRVGCFVKYLEQMGYNCIVFCPQKKGGYYNKNAVINLAKKAVYGDENPRSTRLEGFLRRKIILDYVLCGVFPYRTIKKSKRKISELISKNKIDFVIASYPQFENVYLADWIHRTYGIPWIADFRDIIEEFAAGIRRKICLAAEKRILKTSNAIITVSDGLKKYLTSRHSQDVFVIPNGFDPDDYQESKIIPFKKFTLSYTGNLTGMRTPLLIFQAIDELIESNLIPRDEVQINFYGSNQKALSLYTKQMKNHAVIRCYTSKSKKTIIRIQQSSQLLLLLTNVYLKIEGIMTGKLYEYLIAKRPILAVPNYKSIDDLLRVTRAGHSFDNKKDLQNYIYEKYKEWKTSGKVGWDGDLSKISQFSRKIQTQKLAMLIESCLA